MSFRILISEHEPETCNCLRVIFEEHGYQVRIVHAPEDVLRVVGEFLPHMMIINYFYLPVSRMTGIELLRRIREKYSNGKLPVIVASGHCQLQTIDDFMRLGIHDFVSKPVAPDYLVKLVDKCLH